MSASRSGALAKVIVIGVRPTHGHVEGEAFEAGLLRGDAVVGAGSR
ncbi:hypothetical protein FHT28_007330, partial [Rhizobium sp. SG570]|nr:hypothetical protein [Rhizobium sp. SG570]